MNIYISHSREFDFKKDLYEPLKSSSLFDEYNFILPHDSSDSPYLSKEMLRNKKIDLIIAEVSFPSTGQGIELAWADQFKVPIECIYKKGEKYSGSLNTVTNHFSEYDENLVSIISNIIRDYGF